MNYLIHSDLSRKIEILSEAVGQDYPSDLSSQIEILSTALQHQTEILTRDQFCPANGGVSFINTGNCYLESSQATTNWSEARAECQKNGGDLATIDSQATQDFLVENLKDTSQYHYTWIGAGNDAGVWSWADGTPWTRFNNWASGQPDEGPDVAAVITHTDGFKWWDCPKTGKCRANYLCQYSLKFVLNRQNEN